MAVERVTLLILFIKLSVACDSERLFFGSINESFPVHVEKNGIYVRHRDDHDGFPMYKHESRDYYIYHVSGNILPTSYWVIGPNPGSLSVSVSVQTRAETPDLAEEKWRIWSEINGIWKPQRHLSVTCLDESFLTCNTGKVRLHGLSPWNRQQINRTGTYIMTDQSHNMRPVYRHKHAENLLYYEDGLWMIGPQVGQVTAAMFVLDYAWRPEYITEDWIVFNGEQFQRDTRLKLTCSGANHVNPLINTDDTILHTSDIINIAEGMLGDDEEDQIPVCNESYCHNGGTCIKNADDVSLCACREGFVGIRCEQVVNCGDAPSLENGDIISQTGQEYQDLTFYACAADFHLQGDSAALCLGSGEWGRVPVCIHWLDYINPGISGTVPSRRHLTRSHGRSHHRRNRRSLLPVTINDMKAMF